MFGYEIQAELKLWQTMRRWTDTYQNKGQQMKPSNYSETHRALFDAIHDDRPGYSFFVFWYVTITA